MPLRLNVTLELSDAQLAQIADHIGRARTGGSVPVNRGLADLAPPADWKLVEEREGETYSWPEETDEYKTFRVYEAETPMGSIRLAIGRCDRVMVRDEEREYFITGHIGETGTFRPIAEFLATDDYAETGETIAVVKGKAGSARMYDPGDELPAPYSRLRTEIYRDRVDKPYSYTKLGVVAGRDDVDTMLGHTFIQAVSRLNILPD
jgi:hypothetical protein